MGGFNRSKELKIMLEYFDAASHTDQYYEALEQCIVMTEAIEAGDNDKIKSWHKLLSRGDDSPSEISSANTTPDKAVQ